MRFEMLCTTSLSRFAFLLLISIVVLGCTGATKWEYKIVSVFSDSVSRTGPLALQQTTVDVSTDTLQILGQLGWELVDSYLEMETAFPNFGNDDYHTGIKTNTRPQRLVMIFKRPQAS